MEETAVQAKAKTPFDPDAFISEKIISKLEQGIVPWQRLWGTSGTPRNLITKEQYKGINALLLGMEGYENNWFLTFDEVNSIGGKVKKDSKGHTAVKWTKTEARNGNDEKASFSTKVYTVFNVAQCDKLPEKYLAQIEEQPAHPSCEYVAASMRTPPRIESIASHAYYEVVDDIIYLPKKNANKKDATYYAALFRQLVHSTGNDQRLARKGVAELSEIADIPLYSQEDLVGDIGLCFLMSTVGASIVFKNDHAYVSGWIAKLREHKKMAIIAAAQAQKSIDYILGKSQNEGKNE